jgi:hypothetical protein
LKLRPRIVSIYLLDPDVCVLHAFTTIILTPFKLHGEITSARQYHICILPLTEVLEQGCLSKFEGAAGSAESLSTSGQWRLVLSLRKRLEPDCCIGYLPLAPDSPALQRLLEIFEQFQSQVIALRPDWSCMSCNCPSSGKSGSRHTHLRSILRPYRIRTMYLLAGIGHKRRLKSPGRELAKIWGLSHMCLF